jgi:hypothetical protein
VREGRCGYTWLRAPLPPSTFLGVVDASDDGIPLCGRNLTKVDLAWIEGMVGRDMQDVQLLDDDKRIPDCSVMAPWFGLMMSMM